MCASIAARSSRANDEVGHEPRSVRPACDNLVPDRCAHDFTLAVVSAPNGETTGWYLWAGEEFSEAPDFFEPVHVLHLAEICPSLLRLLGLPPGWRFLTHGEYLDVWGEAGLLDL